MLEKEYQFNLLCDYLDELHAIQRLMPLTYQMKLGFYAEARMGPCSKWIDVCDEQGKVIGFLIVGWKENCHPAAHWFVQDAYIKPEYRKLGYMTRAVSNYVRENPGTYCLFVLTKNQYAYHFWHKVFEQLGYQPHALCDVGAGDEHCIQYGFAPMEKRGEV